jgi:nitrilase
LYRRKSIRENTTNLIVVSAAFTKDTGLAHWEILLRARAIENQAYVLASAQGGRHPSGRETWGHSMFISPWGDIIKKCGFGEDLVFGNVDFDYLRVIRKKLPSLEHQKFNLEKRRVC